MTPKERKQVRRVIAYFIKVARHARNFPHPEIPIELLRSEAVEAETMGEYLLGKKEYNLISKRAFEK